MGGNEGCGDAKRCSNAVGCVEVKWSGVGWRFRVYYPIILCCCSVPVAPYSTLYSSHYLSLKYIALSIKYD